MNKTIYEAEFTKMVHDKMREANRFKEVNGRTWVPFYLLQVMP